MGGFIKEEDINEVRERNSLVEVVSEYVTLKKAGKRFKALCPFHQEKTPSFIVDPAKQLYHCFGCLPKGSLIKTEKGISPIETIQTGQKVLSGKGRYKEVIRTFQRFYQGEMIDIKLRKLSETISLTSDHKVFAINTKRCKYEGRKTKLCQPRCRLNCPTRFYLHYKIEKIAAGDLSQGDYLLYPLDEMVRDKRALRLSDYLTREPKNYGPSIKELPDFIDVDDNFLKLIGYWIAEGSNHRAYIRFSLGHKEESLALEIKQLLKQVFGLEAGVHTRVGSKTGIEVSCCNSNLANIFENLCGKGASNKVIPFELMHLPHQKHKVLVESIFKGDGHMGKGGKKSRAGRRNITTTSPLLAAQLKDILLRLGFFPSINIVRQKIDFQGVNHQKAFNINWTEDLKLYYFDTFYGGDGIFYWALPIKHLNRRYYEGLVYNLTVDEDHSYVANNFSVGNCGEGGNVYTFVMKMDKLDFPEAVKHLADRVGYTLHLESEAYVQKRTSLSARLYEVNKEASQFYQRLLKKDEGEKARQYLKRRGYTEDTIDYFKLGLATSCWDGLFKFLYGKGFKPEELEQAGLVIKGKGGSFYDRFRKRIIFPISDLKGRVLGFGGRALDKEEPKYMNSPETLIYHKGSMVYNIFGAKNTIVKLKEVLVVEGYTDVLSLHQAGIKNVVATLGTAFTSEHLHLLARFGEQIKLIFDADQAGTTAAQRGLELLGESKVDIFVVSLPSGDPADFVTKEGREKFEYLLKTAPLLIDFCLDQIFLKYDLRWLQQKLKASQEALAVISALKNAVAQEEYLRKLAQRLGISLEALLVEFKKLKEPKKGGRLEPSPSSIRLDAQFLAQKELLKLVLQYPKSREVLEQLNEEDFTFPDYQELFLILKSYSKEKEVTKLLGRVEERVQKRITELMLEPVTCEEKEKYLKEILSRIKEFRLGRQINSLKTELERLNPLKDALRYDALFEQLLELENKRRRLREAIT